MSRWYWLYMIQTSNFEELGINTNWSEERLRGIGQMQQRDQTAVLMVHSRTALPCPSPSQLVTAISQTRNHISLLNIHSFPIIRQKATKQTDPSTVMCTWLLLAFDSAALENLLPPRNLMWSASCFWHQTGPASKGANCSRESQEEGKHQWQ